MHGEVQTTSLTTPTCEIQLLSGEQNQCPLYQTSQLTVRIPFRTSTLITSEAELGSSPILSQQKESQTNETRRNTMDFQLRRSERRTVLPLLRGAVERYKIPLRWRGMKADVAAWSGVLTCPSIEHDRTHNPTTRGGEVRDYVSPATHFAQSPTASLGSLLLETFKKGFIWLIVKPKKTWRESPKFP